MQKCQNNKENEFAQELECTAAFTYNYDPVILRYKFDTFVEFQRPSSEKVRFKRVYGLLLYVP